MIKAVAMPKILGVRRQNSYTGQALRMYIAASARAWYRKLASSYVCMYVCMNVYINYVTLV